MNRGAFRGWAAVAASITVCLLAAVAAPVARAGTIWVTDGAGSCNAFSVYANPGAFIIPSSCPMTIDVGNVIPLGMNAYWMTTAPPGITINHAWTANGDVNAGNWTTGIVVGDFWQDVNTGAYGGSTLAQGQHWFNTALEGSSNINSQIYGIQIVCTQNNWTFGGCSCSNPPWFTVSGIELQGTENSAPYVTGQGALWTSGSYVWNPPGDDWSVALYSSDVSGICSSEATVGGSCAERSGRAAGQLGLATVPESGELVLQCRHPLAGAHKRKLPDRPHGHQRGGGRGLCPYETVFVDNDPVGVSFRTPNDDNPTSGSITRSRSTPRRAPVLPGSVG